MARLRQRLIRGRQCVTISGNLCGRDLRRLERLCGAALEQEAVPLTLRLFSGTTVDSPAQAYLERLVARGAVLQVVDEP